MKIAIHNSRNNFSERWEDYCRSNNLFFIKVDCYANEIISNLEGCDVLLWHHFQTDPRDILFAKQLLFSLEHSGMKVFPDFYTNWHFDDKIGQKYLLESIGAPIVPTYLFFRKYDAYEWIKKAEFPKVQKLRCGAGSSGVQLVRDRGEAAKAVRKAFGKGFKRYRSWSALKETFSKYRMGKFTASELFKAFVHLFFQPEYAKITGAERGYIYFQDFIPGNDHDIRVVVIDNKAFAIKRLVRPGDFRASGSGLILYEKNLFDEKIIRLAFDLSSKLKTQCIAFDFIDNNGITKLLEISYGFVPSGYDNCEGYWDNKMIWHAGKFNPYGWIIEALIRK